MEFALRYSDNTGALLPQTASPANNSCDFSQGGVVWVNVVSFQNT